MVYDVVCTSPSCGHKESDVFCRASEFENLRCSCCGARVEQNYATKRVGVGGALVTFRGIRQESIRHFNDPAERERYGSLGQCIQNDWTVRFNDREEERKFTRRTEEIAQEDKARFVAQKEFERTTGRAEEQKAWAKKRAMQIAERNIRKAHGKKVMVRVKS